MILLVVALLFMPYLANVVDVRPSSLSPLAWEYLETDAIQRGIEFGGSFSDPKYPAARRSHLSMGVEGRALLFVGFGFKDWASPTGTYADVWLYDTVSNTWEYVDSDSAGTTKSVGVKGRVNAEMSYPGSRNGVGGLSRVLGIIYIFGGSGFSTTQVGFLSDLWRFEADTKIWTFLSIGLNSEQWAGIKPEEESAGPRYCFVRV